MDASKLQAALEARGEPPFRLKQVLKAVFQDGAASYAKVTTLPAALREALGREAPILSIEEAGLTISQDGRAHKAALKLGDGHRVESVLLKPVPGDAWTTCISCQVGCAMACTFCATGLMGLKRSLTPEEVWDQVLFWKQYLAAGRALGRLTNVVYMGMGEPFHCYDTVAASLRVLLDPGLFGLSARHISVSTVGLVPGMERFAVEFPNVNLALSLHAASDALRRRIVPVNKSFPLAALSAALKGALAKTGRKLFLEYVLLAGENDGPDEARDLARFIQATGRPDLLHVNLIAWNPTDTPHSATPAGRAREFRGWLQERGVSVTIRKNLGTDISGACGQLVT